MYLECNFIIIVYDVLKDCVFEFLMINWWNVVNFVCCNIFDVCLKSI